MEALGSSHLKFFVSGRREKERVGFALTRHECGFLVSRKGVGGGGVVSFRANCVASISSASSSQANLESEEIQLDQPKTVRVKFRLQRQCEFGEHFLVVGDDPNLGLWDPLNGVPLIWSEGHVWTAEVDVPSSKVMSYKFILEEIDGTVSWQPGPDRVLETWDTSKVISVSEDWDSPDFQEIVEEEFVSVSSLLVAESVNESLVEGGNGVMEEEVDDSSLGLLVNGTLNEGVIEEEDDVTKKEVGGNESRSGYSDDPLMLMVAENISEVQESSVSNGTTSSFKSESGLVMDEEAHVLVPGLAASPLKEVEEVEEAETEASRIVRSTTTAIDEISNPTQKKNSIVEDTAAEFDEIKDSSDPTHIGSSIVEEAPAEFDEIKDSSGPTQELKNSIVEDSAAEFYETKHSSDSTQKNNSIVEDAAAEFYEIKDSSDHNQRNNDVFEDVATEFDKIEGSTNLNKRHDDILEDTATQPEAASEPEIRISASLHCPETSGTGVAEEKTRLGGKKHMLDIDMQWGRRTLHKFLANLGFMQHG